eukprot:TRINITY_DN1701_c9_g1_i1.p1 TRINITY_DN1701_c9_g1~~TRINITY_DN1701_c9_g1_i1.p1  ORF type:complete len:339 (+),score=117.59 TRINITY_DN1701_c9_g1_i1:54-1019(+)
MASRDAVQQWMDSDDNDEYFYIDDEAGGAGDQLPISVAGCFGFVLDLQQLRIVSVAEAAEDGSTRPLREPVRRWRAAMGDSPFASLSALLKKATGEYKVVMDDLQEADDDSDDSGGGQVFVEARPETERRKSPEELERERRFEELCRKFQTAQAAGSQAATERILADYKLVFLSKTKFGWDASPRDGNLYTWDIRLFDFERGTELWKDVQKLEETCGMNHIAMTLQFPPEYPFKPPFLRVIRPRFKFRTGRVTLGGSICHELLTNKGWKPVNDITSIIETIRAEITDPEAGARVDFENKADYSEAEAREAFHRVAERYGWN